MDNTKSVTIHEFINIVNDSKVSAVIVGREHLNLLNVKNKISKLLNACGYEYDQKEKQWFQYEDKGITDSMTFEQFVEINNLDDFKFKGQTTQNKSNTTSNTNNNVNSVPMFSDDEIVKLREIIKLYDQKDSEPSKPAPTETEVNDVKEAISKLPRAVNNTKKTYVLDTEIVKEFQRFCDKKQLKYSDALSVAINDFIHKYKK